MRGKRARSVQADKALEGFEAFVRTALKDWKVPGAAVVVVKDSEVALCQGFGIRDSSKRTRVGPQTLFPLASVTKAFTAASVALLADEGRLDWDTPIQEYLLDFRLWDPFASLRITARDLLTHRSGLPRHDLLWYNSTLSRRELVERLRFLEPTKDLRTTYQYQNLMYMTAGYLVETLVKQPWEEFVRERLFAPLGMVSTNFSIRDSKHAADCARPYQKKKGKVGEIPYYEEQDALGPAGAIVSNVQDMGEWIALHLNRGSREEQQVISPVQLGQLHQPFMVLSERPAFPELAHASYALGWFVQPYRGRNLLHHGGNIDGFSTLASLMPDEGLGVVVLTNLNANPLPMILSLNLYDRLLGLEEIGWSSRFAQVQEEMEAGAERGEQEAVSRAVPNAPPSHRLEAYAGDYRHPGYGVFSVSLDGEQLNVTYNNMTAPLRHVHYDIFDATYERFDWRILVSFRTNVEGDIDVVTVPLEPMVPDIVFKRVPPTEMLDPAFLEGLSGEYEVLSGPMTVSLRTDGTLTLKALGNPEIELEPRRGTEFKAKGLTGFTVEFIMDDNGRAIEAILREPTAVFTAKRK